jgi:general secretion pathway protein A
MYAPFFGLSKEPFSIAPDPRFLYLSAQHREALAHLLYGLGGGGGFVLLTGEVGAGKTTVCRCFLEQVPASCSVAYVFNPKLTAAELLQTVCAEFGLAIEGADAPGFKALVDALNDFLLDQHAQGRQAVLVIDEAQSLSADVLEQLRLLTNLETAERKLLQIVLIGQPELRDLLARPELEQLAQRVIARYHLGALSAAETPHYIRHRLAVAGTGAALPFDGPALACIHRLSRGVPRRINLLADRALLGAYAQGRQRANRRTVQQAAAEVFGGKTPGATPRRWAVALGLALTLSLGAALGWALNPKPGSASVPATAARAGPPSPVPPARTAAVPLNDPAELLAAGLATPALAWRELALRWQVVVGEGDPCVAVRQAQLACLHSTSGGLPLVRQLSRPGLVTLRGPSGAPVQALLTGLGPSAASLQVGNRPYTLSLAALASIWRGEFDTFWRPLPAWRLEAASALTPALRDWIEARLDLAGQPRSAATLTARIRAFQLAQALPVDGLAGPLTLIALQRIGPVSSDSGAAEPALATLAPTAAAATPTP